MTAIGRPSHFDPELCEQAHNYCLLGATNDDLAEFLHVSPRTIDRWIAERPDFGDAVHSGRVAADARVARALYGRAIGYDRTAQRMVVVAGEVTPVTSTVHYPANVQACIFWLRSRGSPMWRNEPNDRPSNNVSNIAVLEAAAESVRHHDRD